MSGPSASDERRSPMGRREADRWVIWDRRVRDLGIYVVALSGVVNQLFFVKDPSETILIFLAAMLGFPLVLRADELRRDNRTTADKYKSEPERGG